MEESGILSVKAENIFPIIKKSLYSQHDVFLRELISNSVDAITKHQKLVLIGESEHKNFKPKIEVVVDEKAKTLTVKDNGIGMTSEEIKKYINEMAFSSVTDFAEKFEDKGVEQQIIGHFGIGFYSVFMVSHKVEIKSLSFKKDAKAIHWECESDVKFTMKEGNRKKFGTEIILHISDDSKEFLNEYTLKETLEKYCSFMPFTLMLGKDQVNQENPIFTQTPSTLKPEQYKEFYKKLYPIMYEEPLFWIHLNFDAPVPLRGILYFPKKMNAFEVNKNKIKLYSNKVFVSDETQDFIPDFLSLLQGIIDWPDMPLNVSRSALQNHPDLRKIGAQITKKVADKLYGMYVNEKEEYEKIWIDIHPFIKFGCMNDDKFAEKMENQIIFKTTYNDDYTNIKDYIQRNYEKIKDENDKKESEKTSKEETAEESELAKDKSENKEQESKDKSKDEIKEQRKIYYVSDLDAQGSTFELYKSQGTEVLLINSVIDSHFLQWAEFRGNNIKFVRIDSEIFDQVIDKEKESAAKLVDLENKTKDDHINDIFKDVLKDDKITIEVKALKSKDISAMIILPEFTRRFQEMQILQENKEQKLIDTYTFVINSESPIINKILKLKNDGNKDDLEIVSHHIHDLALISQRNFNFKKMPDFIARSNKILNVLSAN